MKYVKQLDSLRAIAALLVILWHWLPGNRYINALDNGAIGVNIFFVLSGFLITGILLANRPEKENESKFHVLKNFYLRRALRIFPIYYLTLFVILFIHKYLGASFSKTEFFSGLTYTINFYFFVKKSWGDLTVHFWSLAVEEQFYLIWPFIILFLKRKYLLPAIFIFISIGIISQYFITSQEFGYIPTYTCFDAFGCGAALAWVLMYKKHILKNLFNFLSVLAVVCFAVLILQAFMGRFNFLPQRTLHSVIALFIINYILLQENKPTFYFSPVLNNKVLLFLGKMSYGLYLYHVPVQWLQFTWMKLLEKFFSPSFVQNFGVYIVFIINFCVLTLITWLSWKLIEKPVLKLKDRFSYSEKISLNAKVGSHL